MNPSLLGTDKINSKILHLIPIFFLGAKGEFVSPVLLISEFVAEILNGLDEMDIHML